MASQDRRRKLTIDEINEYWRRLKEGVDSPSAHKICNAVRILDLALNECEAHLSCRLSTPVWSRIRDDLFDMLVSTFPGHFLVYPEYDAVPAEPGSPWPNAGTLEFYPEHVDTSVVAKAPARLLVAGMGDALATWFEAKTVIAAKKKNQLGGATTLSGEALAKLCYETLLCDGVAALQAVRAHAVSPALERLIEANTYLSGLGFESGGLAIAHSVHNGLTTVPETHNYYHGEKVAFGLLVQLVAEGVETSVIEEVLEFSCSVGLPVTLKELNIRGLSDAALHKVAERATAPGETAHNEPFEVTADMIADAIKIADSLGQHWKRINESGSGKSSEVPSLAANRA